MIIFDYIFYRFHNLYTSKEKDGSAVFTAALYLSFLEFLILYSSFVTFQVLTNDSFSTREFLQDYKPYSKYGLLLIIILLEIFNYLNYRKKEKRELLQKQFNRHPLNKAMQPWMFLLFGAFLFGLPILIDYLIKLP